MNTDRNSYLILRIGAAFAFLYPAVAAWFSPLNWIGYFPTFMRGIVPDMVLLHTFGITEIIIAIWILSGKKIFIPSVAASIYLVAIVLLNLNGLDVVFRDISILAITVALTIISYKQNNEIRNDR